MKTLVTYYSRYGSTEKYATWLAEKLGADLKIFKETKDFRHYDRIFILSGTYIGWMPLTRFLKKNWPKLEGKKVTVLAVGVAPENDPWSKRSERSIPAEIRSKISYKKLPSAMPKDEKVDEVVKKSNLNDIK